MKIEKKKKKTGQEEYEISGIKVQERPVNRWLIVVYIALAIWGIYYLIFNWGGLGPGL